MKKYLIGTTIALIALAGAAPAAQAAGHSEGYGKTVQSCSSMTVGEAIQAGRAAHPDGKITAKTLAMSHFCG